MRHGIQDEVVERDEHDLGGAGGEIGGGGDHRPLDVGELGGGGPRRGGGEAIGIGEQRRALAIAREALVGVLRVGDQAEVAAVVDVAAAPPAGERGHVVGVEARDRLGR